MARVTIEDCLENVKNRFALVHLTASRVRQLQRGSKRRVGSKNKDVVESLREIARGYVSPVVEVPVVENEVDLKIEIPDIL